MPFYSVRLVIIKISFCILLCRCPVILSPELCRHLWIWYKSSSLWPLHSTSFLWARSQQVQGLASVLSCRGMFTTWRLNSYQGWPWLHVYYCRLPLRLLFGLSVQLSRCFYAFRSHVAACQYNPHSVKLALPQFFSWSA